MSLAGTKVSDVYKDLIELNNANSGISTGDYVVLKDGAGVSLPIKLKKESVAFQPVATDGELIRANQQDGTKVFSVNTSTPEISVTGVADFSVLDSADTDRLLMVDASADAIGIQTNAPNGKACLDMGSSIKPVVFPKLTTTQRDAVTASSGMAIYNTTTNTLQFYNGSTWATI